MHQKWRSFRFENQVISTILLRLKGSILLLHHISTYFMINENMKKNSKSLFVYIYYNWQHIS